MNVFERGDNRPRGVGTVGGPGNQLVYSSNEVKWSELVNLGGQMKKTTNSRREKVVLGCYNMS